MRSTIGLENMESDALRHCADYPAVGWKAHAWALQTCTRIVVLLARRNYDPKTKKPPKSHTPAALETATSIQETVQS